MENMQVNSKANPNPPLPPVRVLIVDDHPLVRGGLLAIESIDPGLHVVGQCATAASSHIEIIRLRPDLLLLDLRLPDGDGLEVCRFAKAFNPRIHVLILTSYADSQLVLAAMEAGAEGYLLKENDAAQIVAAIRAILAGRTVFESIPAESRIAPRPLGKLAKLSPGEMRVIAEVARGRTDKEVADTLGLRPKTIRNCLDRIFTKLGVNTRTAAAIIFSQASLGATLPASRPPASLPGS
jgi:DNA-binding NarL/FixJ family response regulator